MTTQTKLRVAVKKMAQELRTILWKNLRNHGYRFLTDRDTACALIGYRQGLADAKAEADGVISLVDVVRSSDIDDLDAIAAAAEKL